MIGGRTESDGTNVSSGTSGRISIAVLDDYQGVALKMANWSALDGRAKLTVFCDHLSDEDAIVERLEPFDVVCLMRERTQLPRSTLERLPRLRLICSTGPKTASLDVIAAKERGITVCYTGSGGREVDFWGYAMAEMTWGLILASVRNLPAEAASVRQGGWGVSVGASVRGKTLGVVGLGHIGIPTARIARLMGMDVIAWSPNLTREVANQNGARLVSKDELFREADIITIHLVLSPRSRGTVGAHELGLMKPTAYLVNTSRGPIVDEDALVDALKNKRIAGVALDVFGTEPLPADHPFRRLGNVIATPHVGYVIEEAYHAFYGETVQNIVAWLDGKPMRVMES